MRKCMAVVLMLMLLAAHAIAMTNERAEALVRSADPRAEKARQFWVYPEGDGAWVFYGTGYRKDQALFKGGFWYVTEAEQYPLGKYTENVYGWGYSESAPPVFYSDTIHGENDERHPHAAFLKDGAPLEIEDFGALVDVDGYHGCLVGYTKHDRLAESERVFIGLRGDKLVEIAARFLSEAEARRISGVDALLDELSKDTFFGPEGTRATEFLFRNAVPGEYRGGWGSLTLNVENNGTPGHLYAYIDRDGRVHPNRGWENELAIIEGAVGDRYGVGLEIVETVVGQAE